MRRRAGRIRPPQSGFTGFRFPPEVIMVAVRWYVRYVALCPTVTSKNCWPSGVSRSIM
jgi:transposase-like protein